MIQELITKNRSYRRFNQGRDVSYEELVAMVNSARLSPSAANRQRARFILVNSKDECDKIFPLLSFAGYLKDWCGPTENERPKAYILILTENEPDTNLSIDIGIYAQSILLTATEMGLGGCMFRSFKRDAVSALFPSDSYHTELVIALGEPSEEVYITDVLDGDIKYYRDENDAHVVPKRTLDELILK